MLLTLSTTRAPATDLGYLLHKHPARLQTFPLAFGQAHVCYPQASDERCTAAFLLEVDPIALVRRPRRDTAESAALDQYVNDRPYVASSFFSVALGDVFRSALAGRCTTRPDLVDERWPLVATLAVLPCHGGESLLHGLFEPLGYRLSAQRHVLDPRFPAWGNSPYFTVSLHAETRVQDLLRHLYTLIPVLDDQKHYWVGDDEVEKLLRHGEGWLASHPEREMITARYLRHQRRLINAALARLLDEDEPDREAEEHAAEEAAVEERISLHQQRLGAVQAVLRQSGARRVLDLGCGEGRLLRVLLADGTFTQIAGMDVSQRALALARERLHLDRLPARQQERLTLFQGSLTYRDRRLAGYDAAAVVEVIEHLDPPRLAAFERVLFEHARPATVVLTTPNVEYNVRFADLPAGRFRHRDHRFEWTRAEFQTWASAVAERFGYGVRYLPIGPNDPLVGPPSQLAVFTANAGGATP